MDDLPYRVTPTIALLETAAHRRPSGSVAPWVAFAVYLIAALTILDAAPPNFAKSVLLIPACGALVVVLTYSALRQQRQWEAEHGPHGWTTVLVELSLYLLGLSIVCLVAWRVQAVAAPNGVVGVVSHCAGG